MKKSILFISYYHDPQLLTATRNFYLSTLLAHHGFEVHVLSNKKSKPLQDKTNTKIKYHTIDAWDYRSLLRAIGAKDGVTSQLISPGRIINWGYKILLKYPFNLIFGEGGGFYYLKAIRYAKQLIEQQNISHIYSSYRPITDNFIADRLKKQFPHLIWIADFRDVLWWTKNDSNYQKTWLKSLISHMDYRTALTRGIADFWSSVYHKPVHTLYNGLPQMKFSASLPQGWSGKFVINYSGRIYTEFQKADYFFIALQELIEENSSFQSDVMLHYSGINSQYWNSWVNQHQLTNIAVIKTQQPTLDAWHFMAHAHINLVLTWTTTDIKGFIHGKFNEYLAVRKPILCLVDGGRDRELEEIYAPLDNSLILPHTAEEIPNIKKFIKSLYLSWKSNTEVPLTPMSVIESYAWEKQAKFLVDLLEA